MRLWAGYSDVPNPSLKKQEGNDFILQKPNPGRASDILVRILSPRVLNWSCACTCYVIQPSSRPEKATQSSLLRKPLWKEMAAEERQMERSQTDGKFGSGDSKFFWQVFSWGKSSNNDSSLWGEIRWGLLEKHSRAKQKSRQENLIPDGSIWM